MDGSTPAQAAIGYMPPEGWQRLSEGAIREDFLRWAFADFRRFCGLLQILPKDGPRTQFVLNHIQQDYLKKRTARTICAKPRQVGLSTITLAEDVYHFLTHPGARVMSLCQSMATHDPFKNFVRLYTIFFESLAEAGLPLNFKRCGQGGIWELADRDAVLSLVEAGASEAAASKKGRGGTLTRVHSTESGYFEFAAATMLAIDECVPDASTGSSIIHESTAAGAAGWYYDTCQAARNGTNGFKFLFWAWYEDPQYQTPLDPGEVIEPITPREHHLVSLGVKPPQLKWYRAKVAAKGSDKIDQEYPTCPDTCFLTSGRCFFDKSLLIRSLADCREPLRTLRVGPNGCMLLRIWHQPKPNHSYIVSADTSEGIGEKWDPAEEIAGRGQPSKHDASAAVVLERGTGRHMATLWGLIRPGDFAGPLADLGKHYGAQDSPAQIIVERNNHGHATLRALSHELHYPRIYKDRDGRDGWLTAPLTRSPALNAFEKAVREKAFTTFDKALVSQLLKFVVSDEGKAGAAKGSHDDTVLAVAIGWDVLAKPERTRGEVGAGW